MENIFIFAITFFCKKSLLVIYSVKIYYFSTTTNITFSFSNCNIFLCFRIYRFEFIYINSIRQMYTTNTKGLFSTHLFNRKLIFGRSTGFKFRIFSFLDVNKLIFIVKKLFTPHWLKKILSLVLCSGEIHLQP